MILGDMFQTGKGLQTDEAASGNMIERHPYCTDSWTDNATMQTARSDLVAYAVTEKKCWRVNALLFLTSLNRTKQANETLETKLTAKSDQYFGSLRMIRDQGHESIPHCRYP